MSSTASLSLTSTQALRRKKIKRGLLQVFMICTVIVWLSPVLWTVYTSLRPYADTAARGYVSLPGQLNFSNYINAWRNADLPRYYMNSLLVTVPAVILTLLFASWVAFVVSRYSWRFNLFFLMLFTAGNLLPPQVILTPLFRMYNAMPLPHFLSQNGHWFDSLFGLVAINVAFQVGFCTFVLSNYMKTIPKELSEAAQVDGASVWRQYWKIIMPLTRPALGALAILEFTWIYNDFLWAYVLISTGNKRPITAALANLRGVFFTDNNLIAAGAMLAAIPTLTVYFILQRQFIGGLTLGSTKG
jgi:multiple sugar transport system permease protein